MENLSVKSKNGRYFLGKEFSCSNCGNKVYRRKSIIKRSKSGKFFCSQLCRSEKKKDITPDTTPWNKGKTGLQVAWNKGITVFEGPNHPQWRGGVRKHSAGYISIWTGNSSSKLEHRKVMEEYLGRELSPDEVVHHINEDISDNRIENLQLFENNSAHIRHHMALKRVGL